MTGKLKWTVPVVLAVLVVVIILAINRNQTDSNVVKIGCITPLTGEGATYGAATKKGLDLAVQKVNLNGGINGASLEIIYEDDQMSAKAAANAIQKLIAIDRVPVIIGSFGSTMTLAIAPIAEEQQTVLFSASSTADEIRDAGDYVFRNVPPNSAQGKTAAEFVLQHLNFDSACVLHMNNDYGVSLTLSFTENFTKGGGSVICTETYNPGATDFRAQLTKINAQRPPVVFYPGHYQESGLVLKQARELGITSVFIGGDGSYSPELTRIAGGAAEGSYYTLMAMGGASAEERVVEFKSDFENKYGEQPDVYAAYAYDALLIVAEAFRQGDASADGVKTALYQIRDFEGVTGRTSIDLNGEVDKPFGIVEVRNGGFQEILWRREIME